MLVETSPAIYKQPPLEHHNRNREATERSPTRKKNRQHLQEFLDMTCKMMNEKDAEDFKKGTHYTFKLLEFINEAYEISISQQTLNFLLNVAVNRSKEDMSHPIVDSFGSSIKGDFDFVSLFEGKKGITFANQMVQNSDIKDRELLDFIISSSDNRAFQIGGKLALKAYEIESAEKFENYTPTQLLPNVEKTLKTA